MGDERDHYQVLGVSPGADADSIRRAHRKLVRALHPDRHVEANAAERRLAERRMREINEAWQTLRDPERRRSYDATRPSRTQTRSSSAAYTTGSPSAAPPSSTRASGAARRPSSSTRGSGAAAGRSTAGRGAYWDPQRQRSGSGPFSPHASSESAEVDEDDGIEVHPGTFLLLKRGPLVAIILVAVGLFVATAYITGGDDGGTRDVVQPPPLGACVVLVEQSDGFLVDCEVPNDGEVVAKVAAPLECPEDTRYVQVGPDFFCIPLEESG